MEGEKWGTEKQKRIKRKAEEEYKPSSTRESYAAARSPLLPLASLLSPLSAMSFVASMAPTSLVFLSPCASVEGSPLFSVQYIRSLINMYIMSTIPLSALTACLGLSAFGGSREVDGGVPVPVPVEVPAAAVVAMVVGVGMGVGVEMEMAVTVGVVAVAVAVATGVGVGVGVGVAGSLVVVVMAEMTDGRVGVSAAVFRPCCPL